MIFGNCIESFSIQIKTGSELLRPGGPEHSLGGPVLLNMLHMPGPHSFDMLCVIFSEDQYAET